MKELHQRSRTKLSISRLCITLEFGPILIRYGHCALIFDKSPVGFTQNYHERWLVLLDLIFNIPIFVYNADLARYNLCVVAERKSGVDIEGIANLRAVFLNFCCRLPNFGQKSMQW